MGARLLTVTMGAAAVLGCGPVATDASPGVGLVRTRCGGCHGLPAPGRHPASVLDRIMAEHVRTRRARLDAAEVQQVVSALRR